MPGLSSPTGRGVAADRHTVLFSEFPVGSGSRGTTDCLGESVCFVSRTAGYSRLVHDYCLLLHTQLVPPYGTRGVGLFRQFLFVGYAKACPPFRKFNLLVCHDINISVSPQNYCFFLNYASLLPKNHPKNAFFPAKTHFFCTFSPKYFVISKKSSSPSSVTISFVRRGRSRPSSRSSSR